jgi:hypothetical protein
MQAAEEGARAFMLAVVIPGAVVGVPGCVAGGALGAAGLLEFGPEGAVGGAIAGCIDGGLAAFGAAVPQIALIATLTGGATYGMIWAEARIEFNRNMAECAKIR